MKKIVVSIVALFISAGWLWAQPADFIPGSNVIFEDNFSIDPVGDFPARWSTSSEGSIVELEGFPGKWLKIGAGVAVNPELKKKLPEDCTIEFDLVVKSESCPVIFGLTPLSDVAAGNVYYKKIFVQLQNLTGYPDVTFGKDVQDLGSKRDFSMEGYMGRILHVSIAVNKTRLRVYLDEDKVVDLPKLLIPAYRNNFFVAGGEVIPAPEEGAYISNIRIAAAQADARSLLIKQLNEQGSYTTSNINFNPQTNEMTTQSFPTLDTLGQAMVADPSLSVQINGSEQYTGATQGGGVVSEEAVKAKVEKMKAYLVEKFHLNVDRILTGVSTKVKNKVAAAKNSKTGTKIKSFLTEIVKL